LLDVLESPASVVQWPESRWDLTVRHARSARLLGTLAECLHGDPVWALLPARVRSVLQGELHRNAYFERALHYELDCVATALAGMDVPVILLKGAAYLLQGLPHARGRQIGDVDLMVPHARLDEVEDALRRAGWMFAKTSAYDQHYYRAWSHELPSLRVPGHALELDVHHTILQIKGRLRPDAAQLVAAARPLPASPWLCLAPADQILHAAAHLFQDSDGWNKLRDLVDLDRLMRFHAAGESDLPAQLIERSRLHELQRPLWYATQFLSAWFGTSHAAELASTLRPRLASRAVTALACRLWSLTLPPPHLDAVFTPPQRLAKPLLEFRALWLRMPPWLLAYHAANKAWRRFIPASDPARSSP
jgi:hypothetical protein